MLRDAQAERKVTHTTCLWTVTFPPIHGFLPQIKRSRKEERMRVSPRPQFAYQERRRGERACAPKRGKHILIQNKVIAFGIPASNLYLLGNRRSLWGQSVGEGMGWRKGRGGRAPRPGLRPTWLPASTALRPRPAATTRQRCLATTRRETSQLPHRPEPVAAFSPTAHDAGAANVTSSLASRPFAGSRDCADGR